MPTKHTLHVSDPSSSDAHSFGDLCEDNISFVVEVEEDTRVEEVVTVEEVKPKKPWRIQDSVFAPRQRESDAKSFFDSQVSQKKMLDVDWKRLTNKEKFVGFLTREDKKWGLKRDAHAITTAVYQCVHDHYGIMVSAFNFYCILGAGGEFSMQLNEYASFLNDSQIPDASSKACKTSDLDTIFIAANFEANKKSAEAKINDSNSLYRFEFIEALIRIAFAKYGNGECPAGCRPAGTPVEALEFLCTLNMDPNLPPEAQVDSNEFRTKRLYFEEVDDVLKADLPLLKTLYSRYRLKPPGGGRRPKLMKLQHFETMMNDLALVDEQMTIREVQLSYVWSRMLVFDELTDVVRTESITFVDFLEVLCRVADTKAFPSKDELEARLLPDVYSYILQASADPSKTIERRPSAGLMHPNTRPLPEKLEILLGYIWRKLDYDPDMGLHPQLNKERLHKSLSKADKELGP